MVFKNRNLLEERVYDAKVIRNSVNTSVNNSIMELLYLETGAFTLKIQATRAQNFKIENQELEPLS